MKSAILSIMVIFCFSAYASEEKPFKVSCSFNADNVAYGRESLEESDAIVINEGAGSKYTYLKTQKASSRIYVSKSMSGTSSHVSINIRHGKSGVETFLDLPFSDGYGTVSLMNDDKEFNVTCREVAE